LCESAPPPPGKQGGLTPPWLLLVLLVAARTRGVNLSYKEQRGCVYVTYEGWLVEGEGAVKNPARRRRSKLCCLLCWPAWADTRYLLPAFFLWLQRRAKQ
jgi:hypothetical protein